MIQPIKLRIVLEKENLMINFLKLRAENYEEKRFMKRKVIEPQI